MSAPELFAVVTLGLILVAAIGGKLRSRHALEEFEDSLLEWGLTNVSQRRRVASTVLLVEAAVLLILVAARGGWRFAPVFALILGLTLAYVVVLLRRGTHIPCHCFGAASDAPASIHICSNFILLGVAAAGWVFADEPRYSTAGGVLAIGLGAMTAVIALSAGVVASVLRNEEGQHP